MADVQYIDDPSVDSSKIPTGAAPSYVKWDVYTREVLGTTQSFDPISGAWDTLDIVGDVVHESHGTNLVVNTGRSQLLGTGFIPSASGTTGFYYLGVGASAVAAAVTDTRLTYELIGNPSRKTVTDSSGNVPSPSDIQTQTTIVGTCSFYQQLVLQAIFTSSDGNNGTTFNEYGLFTSTTLPGSPVGTSGTMYNHYIDPSPAFKSSTNQVTAVVTIYL